MSANMISVEEARDTEVQKAVIREALVSDDETRVRVNLESTSGAVVYFSAVFACDSEQPATESLPKKNADLEWFYSRPELVRKMAGRFVALKNQQVVAVGESEIDVDRQAPDALVIHVETPKQREVLSLGL